MLLPVFLFASDEEPNRNSVGFDFAIVQSYVWLLMVFGGGGGGGRD